jgi:hypothetical protein
MVLQTSFTEIIPAALDACHRSELHPSDWYSIADWVERKYKFRPNEKQLWVIQNQLNDRLRR